MGRPDARAEVLDDVAVDVGLGEPARDVDRAHHRHRVGQPEDLAHEDRVLVGRHAVLDDRPLADRLHEPGVEPAAEEPVEQPEAGGGLAAVLARRREIDLAHRAPVRRGSCLRSMSWTRVAQARQRVGVDRVRLEVRRQALHDVGDEPEEDARVGHEELRLVVVANQRQPALEDAAILDVGDLGREVVALDAVRVVEEVQRVVDGQAEPGPPGDEPLVDLRRDVDLGDLVEDLGSDGQQPDQGRAGPRRRASPGGCARG